MEYQQKSALRSSTRPSATRNTKKPKTKDAQRGNRRVNVGIEGETPRKVIPYVSAPHVSILGKKVVDVGEEGHTPVKMFHFDHAAAPADTQNTRNFASRESAARNLKKFSSDETEQQQLRLHVDSDGSSGGDGYSSGDRQKPIKSPALQLPFSPMARPTTSRGKSHPSPDEFYDYVIPSPDAERMRVRSRNRTSGRRGGESGRGGVSEEDEDQEQERPMVLRRSARDRNGSGNGRRVNTRGTTAPRRPLRAWTAADSNGGAASDDGSRNRSGSRGSDASSGGGYDSADNSDMVYIESTGDGSYNEYRLGRGDEEADDDALGSAEVKRFHDSTNAEEVSGGFDGESEEGAFTAFMSSNGYRISSARFGVGSDEPGEEEEGRYEEEEEDDDDDDDEDDEDNDDEGAEELEEELMRQAMLREVYAEQDADEARALADERKLRMLGCWLFGSMLRV